MALTFLRNVEDSIVGIMNIYSQRISSGTTPFNGSSIGQELLRLLVQTVQDTRRQVSFQRRVTDVVALLNRIRNGNCSVTLYIINEPGFNRSRNICTLRVYQSVGIKMEERCSYLQHVRWKSKWVGYLKMFLDSAEEILYVPLLKDTRGIKRQKIGIPEKIFS